MVCTLQVYSKVVLRKKMADEIVAKRDHDLQANEAEVLYPTTEND